MKFNQWREDYNCVRPHGSLKNQTPEEMRCTQPSMSIAAYYLHFLY
jgi:transposase InsO family protein